MTSTPALLTRRQRIVLWGSLFLNVLLIAVILFAPSLRHPPPPPPEGFFVHMAEDLSPADRNIFEEIFARHRDDLKHRSDSMHRAMEIVGLEIQHENYDPERLRKAKETFLNRRNEMDAAIDAFMTELLRKLSPDGRKQLRLFPK